MLSARAVEILERQRGAAEGLSASSSTSPEFAKWRRDTEVAIERIFGANSRNITDFKDLRFSLSVFTSSTSDYEFDQAFKRGLKNADAILASMIDEIREYGALESAEDGFPDHLNLIERICLRFHAAARQLQDRHLGRDTIRIEDEYDVQDLFHAFLRLHFDDIRPEEWSPSYAGRASRLDFLLKKERIVVELKKTRASMKSGELGEQLIIDRARYQTHPDCDLLVCFIYDPEGRVGNPVGLERDLENSGVGLKVRVIVAPKS